MTIRHEEKHGRFMINFWHRFPDGRRERIRRVAQSTTRRGAEAEERAIRAALADGSYGKEEEVIEEKKIPTLSEFKKVFVGSYCRAHNKKSTMESRSGEIERYLVASLGDMSLDEIRIPDVDRIKAEMRDAGLSPKTINNAVGTLRRMLRYAEECEVISKVPRLRPVPVPESEIDYLTREDLDRLLAAASYNTEWHDMIFFAARTGLRFGELCELRWGDVDLVAATLRVSRSYTHGEVSSRKNGRAFTTALSPDTVAMLKRRRGLKHLDGEALVFCQPNGKRHIHRRADVALKRCCAKAGMRPIHWHTLRHTTATGLASAGRSLLEIKELLGHRDIASTMIYAHLLPEKKHEAVAALDAQFGQQLGNGPDRTGTAE